MLALALVLTGCSVSVGEPDAISGESLARQVSDALAESEGQVPDEIVCPDDLSLEQGSTTRCTLTDGGPTYGVSVRVSGEEESDGTVPLQIEVDQEPQP